MINPDAFVERMDHHWSTRLQNVPSDKLRAIWRTMAETFNFQIATHNKPEGDRWRVLKPETGSGKTQGLAVYCSMLPRGELEHPGVLIVTRMKSQADDVAEAVNALAGKEVATSHHTDNRRPLNELQEFPVLVITHRAFELGMDAVTRDSANRDALNLYLRWGLSGRKLVVIDEALDLIDEAQVTIDEIDAALGVIPRRVKEQFSCEVGAASAVRNVLSLFSDLMSDRGDLREQVAWEGRHPLVEQIDLTPLRLALKKVRFDLNITRTNDPEANRRIRENVLETFRGVQAIIERWSWYANTERSHTLNTARLIVPEDITGAVVLDATASSNLVYSVFDRAKIVKTPSARCYRNVTINVSRGHSVGKGSLRKNATRDVPKLIANLKERLPRSRKVLVVCHLAVEHHLAKYRGEHFAAFEVAHWNALDGRNDWKDFDTVVLYGLPYLPTTRSANVFMAFQGLQSNDWLNGSGDRSWRQYRDVRRALDDGHLVTSVIQAINRVRCRKVIDEDGNCLPVDVFLLLPDKGRSDLILEAIKREMPDVQMSNWKYDHAKRGVRKSNHAEGLVAFAKTMLSGKLPATSVRRSLGCSPSVWKKLAVKLKDHTSDLARRLARQGVQYVVEGRGRTQRAYLVK